MTHPSRKKRHDRVTSPGALPQEIRADMELAPFDGAVREMDLKWGVDRLPDLVSQDTAAIWGATMANLNMAIEACWSAKDEKAARKDVAACVASALRGLTFMDAEAEVANKPKADTRVFEFTSNGQKIGVMADGSAWPAIKTERPDLVLYTMQEVANALEAYGLSGEIVTETKKHFPKTTVKVKAKPDYANGGDQFNF